jgi:hypothetical protein
MAVVAAAATLISAAEAASAENRWQEAAFGAVAILPRPIQSTSITGASLACAEQRWSFRLRIDGFASPAIRNEDASVDVDGVNFPVKAGLRSGAATVDVPFEMIELLKAGSRLSFTIEDALAAVFSLRGSRAVLDAVAPRCTPVDMSPYRSVVLSETDGAVETAGKLMAQETMLFRQATGRQPVIAAATLDVAPDAELLFASLCGSTSYYGQSGCTLSGFVRQGAAVDWREVYNSEGVALYIDPNASNSGWPNLVTLEAINGFEPMHWAWNGASYELLDPQVAVDQMPDHRSVTP